MSSNSALSSLAELLVRLDVRVAMELQSVRSRESSSENSVTRAAVYGPGDGLVTVRKPTDLSGYHPERTEGLVTEGLVTLSEAKGPKLIWSSLGPFLTVHLIALLLTAYRLPLHWQLDPAPIGPLDPEWLARVSNGFVVYLFPTSIIDLLPRALPHAEHHDDAAAGPT
jgi:hypothetical protein